MPKRSTTLDLSILTVPPTAARTLRTVFLAFKPATWAEGVLARTAPPARALFTQRLLGRNLSAATPGVAAEEFALRRMPEEVQRRTDEGLALATYAPPQRQISAARQGAAEWWNSE